jgi:predicted nucleic acid-binding protein
MALAEFYWAVSRKGIAPYRSATEHLQDMAGLFLPVSYGRDDVLAAAKFADEGRFSFWDAVMLSAVAHAGCTVMLSEDMHDGARLGRIVVRNPFGPKGLALGAKAALGV